MPWLTLTTTHILDRMSDDERAVYEKTGGNDGGDRLGGILTQVTAMVRGRVAACPHNITKLGPTGTIPDELLWAAATIARESLANSIPHGGTENSARSDELKQAYQQLDQAQSCQINISSASGAEMTSAGTYGGENLIKL